MKINEMIKTKRKELGYTQEQVANILQVTTPAVHKWEKGVSYPDITLLPALARLLKTDLNTLLSFKEELTKDEIVSYINQVSEILYKDGYVKCYESIQEILQEYPNCDTLTYTFATILEGGCMLDKNIDSSHYETEISNMYKKVLHSPNDSIRLQAQSALIVRMIDKEEFDEATTLIDAVPDFPIDKKALLVRLYSKQGKQNKVHELLQQTLMYHATSAQTTLCKLMDLAIKEKDDIAKNYLTLISQTEELFDLFPYTSVFAKLQYDHTKKDAQQSLESIKLTFHKLDTKWKPNTSNLYNHMTFKEIDETFIEQMKQQLLLEINTDPDYEYLRVYKPFQNWLKQNNLI